MESSRDPEIVYAGTKLCPAIAYMHHGPYAGWVFCRHPDGQWVTLGRLYPEELTDYEKNKLDHPAMQRMADEHLKETESLTRQLEVAKNTLERIKDHEHCRRNISTPDEQLDLWSAGNTMGHRLCSLIATEGLKEMERVKEKWGMK